MCSPVAAAGRTEGTSDAVRALAQFVAHSNTQEDALKMLEQHLNALTGLVSNTDSSSMEEVFAITHAHV